MLRESLDGGHIKGGVLNAHLEWLDFQKLPAGRSSLAARVSPATARLLETPLLPISWYPFRALVEMDRAIAVVCGKDERPLVTDLGRHSARTNLSTAYRFYNKSQPHEFFASVVRMHGAYIDFGREEYSSLGPTRCQILLSDYRCFAKTYCWSALGYYEQATALQGGKDPHVTEPECVCDGGTACRFEIAWS
jgi:hypothetical protein